MCSVVWRVGEEIQSRDRPWERCTIEPLDIAELDAIDVDMVDAAYSRFLGRTGLGSDRFHPRQLLLADRRLRTQVAGLLQSAEDIGV